MQREAILYGGQSPNAVFILQKEVYHIDGIANVKNANDSLRIFMPCMSWFV